MDDKKYNINVEGIKTLQDLVKNYISNPILDDDSKRYLEGLLNNQKYKSSRITFKLPILWYGFTSLKIKNETNFNLFLLYNYNET